MDTLARPIKCASAWCHYPMRLAQGTSVKAVRWLKLFHRANPSCASTSCKDTSSRTHKNYHPDCKRSGLQLDVLVPNRLEISEGFGGFGSTLRRRGGVFSLLPHLSPRSVFQTLVWGAATVLRLH